MKSKRSDICVKPVLCKGLFWDWRYDDIDWQEACRSIIERVLDGVRRKNTKKFIRFYGMPVIMKALKEDIKFLPDHTIDKASACFKFKKEEMGMLDTVTVERRTLDIILYG